MHGPDPCQAARVTRLVRPNETGVEGSRVASPAESLRDGACMRLWASLLPPDPQRAKEGLFQRPGRQVRTTGSRAAASVECDGQDENVNEGQATGGENKPLFFKPGTNCPSFPRRKGVPVLKPGQAQANGLDLSGTDGFPGMQDF